MENIIVREIKSAMINKDHSRLRALRGIKSQLDLLKTSGKEVTDEIILLTLQKMVKQRKESADIYKSNNRMDLYDVEVKDISVIEEFLPNQISKDLIEVAIKDVINSVGASSMKDMGKVMGIVSKKLAGQADNKIVSELVKSALSEKKEIPIGVPVDRKTFDNLKDKSKDL